jgi:AraC-like DNA-binding protein
MTAPFFNFAKETFRIEKIDFYPPIPRHKHSCYELFFIEGGSGTFYIDCQSYDIQKNTLFLVSPERIHGWERTNNLQAYLIKFDLSIFPENSFSDHLSIFHLDTVQVQENEFKSIENILATLLEEYQATRSFKECTILNLLNILLIYVKRTLPAVPSSFTTNTLFLQLNDLMQQNNYQLTPTTYYAKKLKTSVKLLNQAIKEITGLNSSDYIRSKTILEAKRLLKYDTMTCNEIADHLGFVDPAYFSRFFKREVGIAAKHFRTATDEKYNF